MVDVIYEYNKTRWESLVGANALFTRPWMDLTPETASNKVDPKKLLGNVQDRDVLCLAGGGGQHSAAFSLLGARVTVVDISDGQLQRDRETAAHYGYTIRTFQGDMRHLDMLEDNSFDLVSQPYSLNFVPDCREVFSEVARVLRIGGSYWFMAANPFAAGLGTKNWNGRAYEISEFYSQGTQKTYSDESWVFSTDSRERESIAGPREYRQLLSTLINGLVKHGFVLCHLEEETGHDAPDDLTPGGWDHFCEVLPPWLDFLAKLKPEAF